MPGGLARCAPCCGLCWAGRRWTWARHACSRGSERHDPNQWSRLDVENGLELTLPFSLAWTAWSRKLMAFSEMDLRLTLSKTASTRAPNEAACCNHPCGEIDDVWNSPKACISVVIVKVDCISGIVNHGRSNRVLTQRNASQRAGHGQAAQAIHESWVSQHGDSNRSVRGLAGDPVLCHSNLPIAQAFASIQPEMYRQHQTSPADVQPLVLQ